MTHALPIDAAIPRLLNALTDNNRCLLVAQPGAGKTTRVPLALLEQGKRGNARWLLLEPRRVAARLAAGFMADQLEEPVGQTVGYRVRGENKVSGRTRLEVVTQGILTRMLQDDPMLEGVAGIIFDEFHERSLDADLGLALALDVQQGLRDDLKLLVMSATLDVPALVAALGKDTPVIDCPGRTYEVETLYRPCPLREDADSHQARVVKEALSANSGDVLVFLPGQGEIHRLMKRLQSLGDEFAVLPLHGQLPLGQQQQVLAPRGDGRRRIILSTAVAESSLTVPGVRIVIDAGLERVPVFQPGSGLTRLDTRRVNRASADQRRGRAGREAPGVCYRLWSEEQILTAHGEPEIQQADLSPLLFEVTRWGAEVSQLPWVTTPPGPALASARRVLTDLDITLDNGALTPRGKRCARWPAHPRIAAMLDHARDINALPLACWIAAWLEEAPKSPEIDLHLILDARPQRDGAGNEGRWYRAARQWARRTGVELGEVNLDGAADLFASAYPERIAENRGAGQFRLATGGQLRLPQNHALAREPFLVAVDADGQASGGRIFSAIAIDKETLKTRFREARDWHSRIEWDETAGRLTGEEVRRIGAVIIERRPLGKLPPEQVRTALMEALRGRGEFNWSPEDIQVLGRLRLLKTTLGDPWPDVSTAHLLDTLEDWLAPYLDGLNRLEQVDKLPLGRFLVGSLDWQMQQQLAQLAPTHLTVPSGSSLKIDYSGEEPVLAVKLQEMFGQTTTPTVVNGRVALVIHLLSPARRPVQVTRDLAGFWANTYFDVRKDLKGRYPKHPWPDNPLEAVATRHTKRRSGG